MNAHSARLFDFHQRRFGRTVVLLAATIVVAALLAEGFQWLRDVRRDAEVTEWLRGNAMPLATIDPAAGLTDLRALGAAIGDARIVGAGEATHGTREHFLYKHRLLRFLVTQKGFRAVAFESPWPTGLALNEYVLGGEGDPARLLGRGVFGVWYTQEVLEMVRWMREYNATALPADRVEFAGIDTQLTRLAAREVADYLARVDPEFRRRHSRAFDMLIAHEMETLYTRVVGNEMQPKNTPDTRTISTAVRAVLAQLDRHRERYVAASSPPEFDLVRQHARVLVQQADVCEDANWEDRDRYMAENLHWYMARRPGVKVMIWAHNGHVETRPDGGALGLHLRRRHGTAYVSVGFVLGSGAYRALDARRVSAPGARSIDFAFDVRPRTFNAAMKATGLRLFAADLRKAPRALDRPYRLREGYGVVTKAGADPLSTVKRSLPATHDIVIFIEPTSPALPLRR